MKTFDLTTEQGRKDAIKDLNESFISDLRKEIELCPQPYARVGANSIELAPLETDEKSPYFGVGIFGSEITLMSKKGYLFSDTENYINYGNTGKFNPSDKGSYWRTVHAANILQNWDAVISIVEKYCGKYAELEKEIFNQNK